VDSLDQVFAIAFDKGEKSKKSGHRKDPKKGKPATAA
jgi:hypothetical protein